MIKEHFVNVIQEVVNKKAAQLSTISLLNTKEKEHLITNFTEGRQANYPNFTSIDLFQKQVEQNPHKTAIIFRDTQLTYQELNVKANQLGHFLQKKGVKEEQLVAICLPRSLEMIIAIFAILKAGGAYIPIDADYPEERIQYILEDAKPRLLITQKRHDFLTEKNKHTKIVFIEKVAHQIEHAPTKNVVNQLTAQNLMYVIYTSGSTGKPKGVMIPHKGNVNMAFEQIRILGITPNDNICLLYTSPSPRDATLSRMPSSA